MNRKLVGGLAAAVVVAIGVWFVWLKDRGGERPPVASTARTADVTPATPAPRPEAEAPAEAPRGVAPRWSLDVDPEGPLILEGQVVGPDGDGVAGAKVTLGSVPSRTATTEGDGTFSFDKVVGRTYSLIASSGELLGGPVTYKLTDKSDPVVIRLAEGASLEVTVVTGAGPERAPLAGAEVRESDDRKATTDAQGKAVITPVRPGWVAVEARAPGYAPRSAFTTIGSAGATGTLTIALERGFAVSGKVVDERGRPIARAKIRATAGMWDFGGGADPDAEVVSDDGGRFTIPAVAAGTHTLSAIDGEHAPARSSPITVKDRPVTGVVITMKAGAMLAGSVVEADGTTPVPYATVRVTGKGQEAWRTAARQTTTDQRGQFELRGLARWAVQARAESETAASKIADVDLAVTGEVKDLRLVLDVGGQIAGIVVDELGAPVAEIQVNAFPDLLGGASGEGLALAGMSSAITDGGGGFVIHGLPEGAYRLWAARSSGELQEWGQHGTAARTGDKDVKITLPAPGELRGVIAIAGASRPPAVASVQVGSRAPSPATDGEFLLKNVAPGTYDVTFRGPEFAATIRRDVKIEPGKPTDLGTVTVMRGRRLTGKVVDKSGQPVAGAKIKVGEMLFTAEGSESQMETFEELSGTRVAYADQAGEFAIIGLSQKGTTALADHPERGRSLGVSIPEGTDDPPPLTLALRGFGSITGKVVMKGKPQPGVTVSASSKGGGATATFAQTDDDGTFTIAKVPEGPQVIQAMKQAMMSMKSSTVNVTVIAGKQATVVIDIPVGELTLAVTIQAQPNHQVDAAQVFLFSGVVAPANAKQLTEGFFQGGAQGMKFWLGKAAPMPEFDELVAGQYSVCTIPITGELADPTFQARLQENMQLLRVYCQQVKVNPSPAKQTFVHAVPAMTPLPAPTN